MKSVKNKNILIIALIIVFTAIIMTVIMLIFNMKYADENSFSVLYHATGIVGNIDFDKKEITLTDVVYGNNKTLDKLILLTEDVDLYNNNEERIDLNDIKNSNKLKFSYFDTEEYLLKESAKVKPYNIYDLSK